MQPDITQCIPITSCYSVNAEFCLELVIIEHMLFKFHLQNDKFGSSSSRESTMDFYF
jgi:hypothetical protein